MINIYFKKVSKTPENRALEGFVAIILLISLFTHKTTKQ